MKAARRPWPTAVVIIVGPVTTSPAAKMCGTAVCSVPGSALSVRLPLVSRPNDSVSAPMPAATMTTSHSTVCFLLSSYSGANLPSGSKTQVQTLSSAPLHAAVAGEVVDAPAVVQRDALGLASSTSKSWAGISSQHSRLAWSTDAAPRRRAVRAASMATLPPPTTRTFLPARSTGLPSLTSARKVRALWMPSSSSPGTRSCTALCVPVATRTASKPSSLSAGDVVDARVGLDLDADGGDVGDVVVDDVVRQTVGRDAEAQHAARLRRGLEDLDAVALAGELPGGGEAGRARADDGHLLAVLLGLLDGLGARPGRSAGRR